MMNMYEFKNIKDLIDCALVYGDLIPNKFKLDEKVFIKTSEQELDWGIKYTFKNHETDEEIEYIFHCELAMFEYKKADKIYKLEELIEGDVEVKEEYINRFIDTINKNSYNQK